MEYTALSSTLVEATAYDPDTKTLYIRFKSGPLWQYKGADQGLYEGLLSSGSPGQFFHQNIKHNTSLEASAV